MSEYIEGTGVPPPRGVVEYTARIPTIVATLVWSDTLQEWVQVATHETKELHECHVEVSFIRKDQP
jgi:hypothetical protein